MKIDIGCGANKKPGYLGVDKTPGPAVDFVINFEADRLPFGDDTVEAIYSSHCIEHLSDPPPPAVGNATGWPQRCVT